MEKLKNLLHPGKKDDDEVLYGSGKSSDPVHSGTTGTTGTNPTDPAVPLAGGSFGHLEEGGRHSDPLDNTGNVGNTSTAETGSSTLGSGTTGTYDDSRTTATSGLGDTSARSAGAYDNDASSTTAIRGGVPGDTHTLGSAVSDSRVEPIAGGSFGHLEEGGRHSDPLDNSGNVGNTTDTTGTGSGLTGGHTNTSKIEDVAALRGEPNTLNQNSDSTTFGTDDPRIGSGQTSRDLPDRSVETSTGGSSSITDKIREVASGRGERGAQGTASDRDFPLSGGNSSTVTDTRGEGYGSTPSEGYGSKGVGASSLGRDAMLRDTDNYTSETTAGTTGTSHLGRDAALGGAAVGGAGLAEHEHRRDIGDSTGNTTGTTTGTTASSTTGLGSGYGSESWDHDHSQPHAFEGDPCGPGAEPVGPHFTEGPHILDTANRLDPHASTRGAHTHGSSTTGTGLGSSTGTGLGSSTNTGLETTTGQEKITGAHTGRDAALAGGAGVAGVGAYEEGRQHDTTSTGTDPSDTGPVHKSSLLNKLDPRVKQDTTSTQGAAGVEGAGTTDRSGHGYRTEDVGGMAGARVVVPYETEKNDYGGSSQYGGSETLGHKHHDPAQSYSIANTGSSEYPGTHRDNLDESGKHHKYHEKEHHTEKEHEKKSGGLLGFLHKDKSDKDTVDSGTQHERNRLHKDPPASMMAGNTDYAEAPTSGYASQVTGGTGTTALAQGDSVQRGSHLSGAMNKLDPAVGDRADTVDESALRSDLNTTGTGGTGQYGQTLE